MGRKTNYILYSCNKTNGFVLWRTKRGVEIVPNYNGMNTSLGKGRVLNDAMTGLF